MSRAASPLATFHRIGDRSRLDPATAPRPGLKSALLARYGALDRLRFDAPLVLRSAGTEGPWVESLPDAIDRVLAELAPPGPPGETLRRQLLALEQQIRTRVFAGQAGALSDLWSTAHAELADIAKAGGDPAGNRQLDRNLRTARERLALDGEVVACDAALPRRLLTRAWKESERRKAHRLHRRIARLAQKLADILEVDDLNAPEARSADRLERAVGAADRNVFDFDALSDLLRTAPRAERLPQRRRQRVESALATLRGQRFVSAPGAPAPAAPIFRFRYEDARQALAAFRERLPAMAELVRAMGVAELESGNRYDPERHDAFFAGFDENRLGPADLAPFPAYLLCLESLDADAEAVILRILRSGLPFKVLAQPDDVIGGGRIDEGDLALGLHGQQLARMALGLDKVFVLQASTASLYRLRDAIDRGLGSDQPALFCVYAGADYLDAAAATESRAFPCFTYDPSAGAAQKDRFSLLGNPQPEAAWACHTLDYEDADHAARQLDTAFTLVDFLAAQPRFADRFACIARADWTEDMAPLAEYLGRPEAARGDTLPYVLVVDPQQRLLRAVVDERLVDAAQRCRDAWRSLQEWGGIRNSHAEAAARAARAEFEAKLAEATAAAAAKPAEAATPAAASPAAKAEAAEAPAAEAAPEPAPQPSSDDPWIETVRCTTCNECTQLNDRMFGYDADQRAYIKDPDAGTYRQLVEAAESCQVAIIHPGKPRNPDEPGLEELIKRAEPYL